MITTVSSREACPQIKDAKPQRPWIVGAGELLFPRAPSNHDKHRSGTKKYAPTAEGNQRNQIQFEKLERNNKVGNYIPAKVGRISLINS